MFKWAIAFSPAELLPPMANRYVATAVLMKKSDVAEKQEHDRQEWQKHGGRGGEGSRCRKRNHHPVYRDSGSAQHACGSCHEGYGHPPVAPDSVKFDDAKPGTLDRSSLVTSFACAAPRATMARRWLQRKSFPEASAASPACGVGRYGEQDDHGERTWRTSGR